MSLPLEPLQALPLWHAALLLVPLLAPLLASLFPSLFPSFGAAAAKAGTAEATWRCARLATTAALACAAASTAAVALGWHGVGYGLRADALGALVSLLVAFVGWVIVRYSQPYLNGQAQERHFVRWLMATLAAVGLVLVTNHLLVLVLAWAATSLALHRLLTFFSSRPAAVLAAHKKFIVSRLADLCLFGAAALLLFAFGTLHIDQIMLRAASSTTLPGAAQAAVLLLVCAALLKCAQLPFHGWLIQVMEAPTPVSALLHAGVVNLGGFVLMRFAPLVNAVPAAQVLLVVVSVTTAVLAALVMSTRISIKVSLAWSTCAQMGFMLMQCGLGAWRLALLHLLAHALYKAHAFLGAGGAVRRAVLTQLTPRAAAPGAGALVCGALLGMAMAVAGGAALGWLAQAPAQLQVQGQLPGLSIAAPTSTWVLSGIVALALVPLLHAQAWRLGGLWLLALGTAAFAAALAYHGLQALLGGWTAGLLPQAPALSWPLTGPLAIFVAVAFVALFVLQSVIALAPRGALARRLYPWFFGGLFLDERFSRLAFGLWRPPLPAAGGAHADLSGAAPGPASTDVTNLTTVTTVTTVTTPTTALVHP